MFVVFIQEKKVYLIISDLHLGDMTGLQVLEELKKDAKLGKIPFIVVTSDTEKSEFGAALKLGVAGYLLKPFNAAMLCSKISETIGRVSDEA